MKNRWMKTMALLLGGASLMVGVVSCEKEEQFEPLAFYQVRVAIGLPGSYGSIYSYDQGIYHPVDNVELSFYDSEENYLQKKNPIQVVTPVAGEIMQVDFPDTLDLWVYAKKGDLTSSRYTQEYKMIGLLTEFINGKINDFGGMSNKCVDNYNKQCYDYYSKFLRIGLTVEPAKFQINVLHNGEAVQGADVQLYLSQEAYETDLKAQADYDNVKATYGYSDDRKMEFSEYHLKEYFNQLSNSEGSAYFSNLEPRRYWFKITKDGMSNSSGTITIEQPLNNTSEASRVVTVGIN